MSCRSLFIWLLFLLAVPLSAAAAVTVEVQVSGIEGPIYANVMARLTINLHRDSERLQPNTVRKLHRQAKDDIRSALAPFGYYNPVIEGSLAQQGETFRASYRIDKGPPVRVEEVTVELAGDGRDDDRLIAAIGQFPVKKGEVLDQQLYEQGKKTLVNLALSEGYLDAGFSVHTLRINRQDNLATVQLVLDCGRQYLFGATSSNETILEPDLLKRYLPYTEGEPYRPAKLFDLQSTLYRTDYFSQVVVKGRTEAAVDQVVPVEIDLAAPEHRNKYSLGFGYATDTGLRGKVDWSNRLFNSRGHQASAGLQLAQLENVISLGYDIPRGDPRYRKLVTSVAYQDRKWEDTDTQLFSAAVREEYNGPRFSLSGGLELRDEVYDVGATNGTSILLAPSLKAGALWADNLLDTKKGFQTSVGLLGAVKGLVSDASFLQATVNGKAIISPFDRWRLITRGTLGGTLVDTIDLLPPSLRFYTGGDSTIRGYAYKSIGTKDASGAVIGGRYLVVGSVEVEREVTETWSVATFWDAGTATDDLSLEFFQGAGAGLRYRLPFGQIRLDLAAGVSEEDIPFRIHLTVGGGL